MTQTIAITVCICICIKRLALTNCLIYKHIEYARNKNTNKYRPLLKVSGSNGNTGALEGRQILNSDDTRALKV